MSRSSSQTQSAGADAVPALPVEFGSGIDDLPIIAWRGEPAGQRTHFNRAWSEFTGVLGAAAGWESRIHPEDRAGTLTALHAACGEQQSFTLTYRLRRRDESYAWVRDIGRPLLVDGTGCVGYTGVVIAIDEETTAQRAQDAAELRWQRILESAGISVWDWNPQSGIVTFSAFGKAMLGYAEEDIEDTRDIWYSLLHPDDRVPLIEMAEAYRRGEIHDHQREVRLRCKDGSYRWILSSGRTIEFDERGLPRRVSGIHTDISMLKEMGESLRRSEQRLLLAMDHAQMAWFSRDIETNIGIGSPSLATIYGLDNPVGPWHYNEIRARILPEDLPNHVDQVASSLRGRGDSEPVHTLNYRIRRPDGEIRHLEVRYRNEWESDRPRSFGLVFDVTRTKQTEIALRETDARLQVALEHARMAWFERNIRTGEMRCSRSMWTIYGYDPEAGPLTFDDILRRLHPDDRERHLATPELLFNQTHNNEETRVITYRVQSSDASYRWVEVRYRVSLDANDGQGSVYGLVFDITDAKNIEDALRASQARLHLSLEAAGSASWYWLLDEGQVFSPDRLDSLYGLPTLGPWSLEDLSAIIHPEDWTVVRHAIGKVQSRETDTLVVEFRLSPAQGDLRWIEARARAEYDVNGEMHRLFGVSVDITARKEAELERNRMQMQLQQAQKMEAIGLLTGGIAHDFNNILGSILGYSGLAQQRFGQTMPPKLAEYIGEVQAAGERARDLVSQMLAFSRGESTESVPTDIDDLIRSAIKMLRPTLPATIEIHLSVTPNLPLVTVDPVQVQQVLVNFCINARDAMGGTGNIWIELGLRGVTVGTCSSCHASFDGDYISLGIRDDGPGIPESIRMRIFEPFFSTKGAGRGAGMGLAMTHGIAHRHGGHVLLDARPDGGACFELLLPFVPTEEATASPGPAIDVTPFEDRSDFHVLVVDDEASIGRFVGELLEMNGYRVTIETDATRALQRLEQDMHQFDLLLTDQTMPRVTGAQLAIACRQLNPAFPVVMMTGYSATIDAEKAHELGIRAFLHKPLRADDLMSIIGKLRDERPVDGQSSPPAPASR